MLTGTYKCPVLEFGQTDVAGGVHTATGRVNQHGDGWTDITARTGCWMGLMKPDAYWDIILTSCRVNKTRLIQTRLQTAHIQSCTSILMGTIIGIMHLPAPNLNPTECLTLD